MHTNAMIGPAAAYGASGWNSSGPLSTASSTFDMMSQTVAQAVASGNSADYFSAGLSVSPTGNILGVTQNSTLDKLLLGGGGRSDSGSSFAFNNQSSVSDNAAVREDDLHLASAHSIDSTTNRLLGHILPASTPDWTQNPFLYSTAPSSPLHAMPLVPVASPLLIPGQPCLGNFISLDNLVTSTGQPSAPTTQSGQQDDLNGQRSWVQASAATTTSPMFAFVNSALSTAAAAAPPFQLASQNSLTSLNFLLSTSTVPPPPPNPVAESPRIFDMVADPSRQEFTGDHNGKGNFVAEAKKCTMSTTPRFVNSPSTIEVSVENRIDNAAFNHATNATGNISQAVAMSSSSVETKTQVQLQRQQLAAAAEAAALAQQQPQLSGFGQSFFIQGAPAHFSQGPVITSPVTSPAFTPQVVQSGTRLITSPVLAATATPGSLLPINVLHPPAFTPVSISPQRSESPAAAILVQSNMRAATSPPLLSRQAVNCDLSLPPPTTAETAATTVTTLNEQDSRPLSEVKFTDRSNLR